MACWVLVMLLFNTTLEIKPAGSSLPELIRKPALKRVKAVCNWLFDCARDCCASSELTFVLIRVMPNTFLKN